MSSYSNGTAGQLNTGPAPPPSTPRQPQPGRPQSYAATSALYTSKDSADRLLWEMRAANRTPNTTPVSTVLNSPDLTDLDTKMRYQHSTLMQHHQIKVGRSPVGSGGNNDSNGSTNPSSPTALRGSGGGGGAGGHRPEAGFSSFSLLSDGEMVVFDDIDVMGGGGGSWRMAGTDRDILGSSPVPSENENSCASSGGGGDERNYYDVDSSKIQRIIGGLTIAEYEGSPRRFGNIDRDEVEPGGASGGGVGKIGGIPRPGFPKRVISPCMSDSKGVDSQQQSSELIDLNDDGSEPGLLLSSQRISDSKFNLATYVDYFGSVVGSELQPSTDDLDQNNQTPTNVLLTGDEDGGGGGVDGRRTDDDDYFFSYSTGRNAQNNSYVGHRLATRRGSLERSESDEKQDDSDATVANSYPYYQKYSNHHYHYAGNTAQQVETHNQQQQRYYHSHHARYHGYGSNTGGGDSQDIELYIDSGSRSESELEQQQQQQQQYQQHIQQQIQHQHQQQQHQHQHSQIDSKLRNFTLSPETTDYDSNCGDLDSEVSLRYIGNEYGL